MLRLIAKAALAQRPSRASRPIERRKRGPGLREATLQRSLGAVLAAVLLLVAFAVGVAWRNAQGRFGSADFVAEVRRALAATRLRADPAGGAG